MHILNIFHLSDVKTAEHSNFHIGVSILYLFIVSSEMEFIHFCVNSKACILFLSTSRNEDDLFTNLKKLKSLFATFLENFLSI